MLSSSSIGASEWTRLPKIRFYFDEDYLDHDVIVGLRLRGFDILTTTEAGNDQQTDEEQLSFATGLERAIVTSNRADFCRLHRRWMESDRHHAGMILVHQGQGNVGSQIRGMLMIYETLSAEQMRDRLEFLNNWR